MKKEARKKILLAIVILGILGLITSIYLIESHYAEESFCDFGEKVSCTLVNTSKYSEIFNIPVAVLGTIWFIVTLLMAWRLMKGSKIEATFLAWNIIGILSVVYLVAAEFILKAICPFCTVVHAILITMLVLSIMLYKSREGHQKKLFTQALPWIILVALIGVIPVLGFNAGGGPKENYDALAQCITDKGINMYGSFRCSVCAKERAAFGDSFQYINEIECHPQGENPQTQLCIDKGVEGTPTWIMEPNGEEIKRHKGFLSIDELREFSGCEV